MDNTVNKIILKLSKIEKDFFAKYTKIFKDSSNYLLIYDYIKKNGTSNVEDLRKEYGDKTFIKNLSTEKEILLEKILLSLVNYKFESSATWKIQKDILFIQILIEKEQFEKAQKILNRIKKIAYSIEEFNLLNIIIDIEISLCFKNGFIVDINKLNLLQTERNEIIQKIIIINELLCLKANLQEFQLNENYYTSDLSNFENIYKKSPFYPKSKINSIKANNLWLYNIAACYYIQHDYQNAYFTIKEHYNLYKKYSSFFSRDEVLQLLVNYLYCCCLTKNENEFYEISNDLLNIKHKTKDETHYITKALYYRKLELLHQFKKFQNANDLAIEAEYFIEQDKLIIDFYSTRYLQLLIIRAYIENSNFRAAYIFSTKHYKTIGYEFNSSMFKLFEFLAHYKLGNFENLIYSVDSWAKTIRSKRRQFPIEKILIKFFRAVCNSKNKNENKELINNVIAQLKVFKENNLKYYINHIFDFIEWFERELEEMNTNY